MEPHSHPADVEQLVGANCQLLQKIAEDRSEQLNLMVAKTIDEVFAEAAKKGQIEASLPTFTLELKMEALLKSAGTPETLRQALLKWTLVPYVRLATPLLRELTGYPLNAKDFLQEGAMRTLATGRYFRLTAPEGWNFNPADLQFEELVELPAGLTVKEHTPKGMFGNSVRIDFAELDKLKKEVGQLLPAEKPSVVDLWDLARIAGVSYAVHADENLEAEMLMGKNFCFDYEDGKFHF